MIKALGNTPGHCGARGHVSCAKNESVMLQRLRTGWRVGSLNQWPHFTGSCINTEVNQINLAVFITLLCSEVHGIKGRRSYRLPVMAKENNNKHNFKYTLCRADKKKKPFQIRLPIAQ